MIVNMNLNKALDVGRRALMTQLETIKIAGENISNVNIPGYSRKKLELKTITYGGNDSIYTVESCRVRDKFIDQHIRTENQSLGNWEMRSQFYRQIEDVFLEPSEYSLSNSLSEFWSNWEDLANNPESITPRSIVVQQGITVSQSINRIESRLRELQSDTNRYIEDRVIQINDLAKQLADINVKVVALESSGQEASELRDSRDALVDQVSKLANVKVLEQDTGSITLFLGGRTIVDDGNTIPLETRYVSNGTTMVVDVTWSVDDASANITEGEIAGLIGIRDEIIPGILGELDQFASTLIDAVNAIHSGGYGYDGSTGLDFFTGTGAYDIAVNDEIVLNAEKVAASEVAEPGGNGIALAIANLVDQDLAALGTDLDSFYSKMINNVGTESRSASMMRENAEILVANLEERKESVSGVSLEEETADLIRFQRAYESAAHFMSVIDEMIETLIDMA